jgi:hypothetical protein
VKNSVVQSVSEINAMSRTAMKLEFDFHGVHRDDAKAVHFVSFVNPSSIVPIACDRNAHRRIKCSFVFI